jgi:hypothetical protein
VKLLRKTILDANNALFVEWEQVPQSSVGITTQFHPTF